MPSAHPVWRLVARATLLHRAKRLRYGAGVAAFLLALATRTALHDILPPGYPFVTFFPAVILTAFVAGTGPGALTAILGGLAAWYLFVPPYNAIALDGPNLLAMGFYSVIVAVDIALIHGMRVAMTVLNDQRARTESLLRAQTTMFQELQHRVANNMQFVSALLHIHRRAIGLSPESAQAALTEAGERLATMARVHRRLHDPQSSAGFGEHVMALCQDMTAAAGARNVACEVAVRAAPDSQERLLAVAMLIIEALTNSLKHAFPEDGQGTVRIALDRADSSADLRLVIADDGVGLPADFDSRRAAGLGWMIIQNLIEQLGGTLGVDGAQGTRIEVTFPA